MEVVTISERIMETREKVVFSSDILEMFKNIDSLINMGETTVFMDKNLVHDYLYGKLVTFHSV